MVQLKVFLGAIWGEVSNISAGRASEKAPGRALVMIEEAQEIAEALSKGDDHWDDGGRYGDALRPNKD